MLLSNGITTTFGARYYKDQLSTVFIYAEIRKASNFTIGEVVATLPVGFRPKTTMAYGATFQVGSTSYAQAVILVESDGSVSIDNSGVNYSRFLLNISFQSE